MQRFETHFGLNEKQKICFRLICEWFIAKHVLKKNDIPPLSMVMTGPGGTGKTYVINAVKALMAHYGCEHQIRYLAPTGSAASLIDGMTIHKGLGIKIKSNRNGNVQSRTQLRDEWRFVEVVFIDESSMLSLQLICEMDHAL
ncbi:hypothetical protein P692DRAFT_201725891, partial [Suillus brevipes Sb2]